MMLNPYFCLSSITIFPSSNHHFPRFNHHFPRFDPPEWSNSGGAGQRAGAERHGRGQRRWGPGTKHGACGAAPCRSASRIGWGPKLWHEKPWDKLMISPGKMGISWDFARENGDGT